MLPATDDIPARLAEEIALRGYDDRYIDRNEEREILQIAIQLGVRLEPARSALAGVCDRDGYVLESTVVQKVRSKLREALGLGKLDEAGFAEMVSAARDLLAGKRNDRAAKGLLVQLLEEDGPPPVKVGWLRNWYAAMKRDAGL